MRNQVSSIFACLFLLALAFAQQTITIDHINQQNEQRVVDLYSTFGVATNQFTPISVGNSPPATITAPLVTSLLDKTNPTSSYFVWASSEIQLSGTQTSSAQIIFDQNVSTTQQLLSLLLIDTFNPQIKITQIATLNIAQQFNLQSVNQNIEVSLYAENQGIVLLPGATNSQYFLFSLNGNAIQVSSLLTLQGTFKYLQAYPSVGGVIQFIVTLIDTKSQSTVQLYSIQSDSSNPKLITSAAACGKKNNVESALINSLIYGLKCPQSLTAPLTYTYMLYKINSYTSKLDMITSPEFYDLSNPDLKSVRVIKNQIYALEYFSSTDTLQVNKLTPDFSDNAVSISTSSISANSDQNIKGVFITNDHLVTLISSANIYGYSINIKSKILQFPISVAGYTPYLPFSFANTILLSIQSNTDKTYISQQIVTNIPTLTYTQSTSSAQSYQVTMQNDALKRQLDIQSSMVTFNQYTCQVFSDSQVTYIPLDFTTSTNTISLDSNFSGSNLNPTVGQVSPAFNGTLKPSIQITQPITPSFTIIDVSLIQNIFSVNQDMILIESYDSSKLRRTAEQYQIQFYKGDYTIYFLGVQIISQPLTNVDSSGFFLTTNADSYWVLNGYADQASSFQSITTTCKSTSSIKYSTSTRQNCIAVMCDALLSIYSYNYSSKAKPAFSVAQNAIDISSVPLGGNVLAVSLRSSGLLYIASSTTIICVNINNGGFVSGSITIPKSLQSSQIYLFESSFFLASQANTVVTINQLSYNDFNGAEALYLRQLMNFDYTWTISNTFSGITQVINPNPTKGSEEYLVIDAVKTASQLPFKLYYKTSRISSENQFYTAVPYTNGKFFFALPSYFGFLQTDTKKMSYNSLSYSINLFLDISWQKNYKLVAQTYTLPITVSNTNYNFQFTLQRNLDPIYGVINSNNNVSQLSNYFQNKQLSIGTVLQFNDSGAYSSNYFGWYISMQLNSINLGAQIQQKISATQQGTTDGYVDILEVIPNSFMYTTLTQTYLNNNQITNNNTGRCTLYRDDSQTKVSSQTGQSTVQVIIYQNCLNTNTAITLTQYSIQGVYTNYPQSVPDVSVTDTVSYQIATGQFFSQNLVRIITDPLIKQTLAIVQSTSNNVSTICQFNLSVNPPTLDCTAQSALNNLQIVNIYWQNTKNVVVYVSANGNAYYNFSTAQVVSIPIKSSLMSWNKNVQANSQIAIVNDLGTNGILIQFDNQSIFIIALQVNDTNNTLIISPNPLVFYTDGTKSTFTGNIYYQSSSSQFVLLFKTNNSQDKFSFILYEQFNSSQDYLATSSHDFNISKNQLYFQNVRIYTQDNSLQAFFTLQTSPVTLTKPVTISLQKSVQLTVTGFDSAVTVNGVGSNLTPIGGSVFESIALKFSQSGTVIVSNSNILSLSMVLFTALFMIILC